MITREQAQECQQKNMIIIMINGAQIDGMIASAGPSSLRILTRGRNGPTTRVRVLRYDEIDKMTEPRGCLSFKRQVWISA